MSKKLVASLSVAGVVGGIAFTIFLTQTLLAPLIEKAYWFPENGALGIAAWLLLYVILALLVAPASFHKFVSGDFIRLLGRMDNCICRSVLRRNSSILAH